MPNSWFTADFHLGHANIIRYCSRPFATVEEMDQAIVERLNVSVKRDDVLYFLGDFCMGGQQEDLCLSPTNSLQENLRRARKSRQTGAQVESKNSPGSTIWRKFRFTANRSCSVTTPCAPGTGPIADHGTSMVILTDVFQRHRTHSPWMWESTHTISDPGSLTKLSRF
jgi:hypothetical protein